MNELTGIERLLARDRLIISIAMLAIFLIAAAYTLMGVGMSMSAVGVLGTENGLYFGYLFGDAQFSNHDNLGANMYFCVRKKQNHEQRIPSNWQ